MARRKTQWHPLLARLLRPRVEGYYELQTDLPVGDVPRQADLVLLRRTGTGELPFRGLWRHLTVWNILEFKGPTVTPRRRDLGLLVELGLGIDRRLHGERIRQGQAILPEKEVTFWYLANRLGPRFLRNAERLLHPLEEVGPGQWRGLALGHPVLLVSAADLPVDEDSLPLHVLGIESRDKQREVGRFLVSEEGRLDEYGTVFAALHPAVWQEVQAMARSARRGLEIDLRPVIEMVGGLGGLIEKIGKKELIEEIGKKELIEEIGKKELIEEIGEKEILKRMDVDQILANLPPAKRRELKRRLNAESEKERS